MRRRRGPGTPPPTPSGRRALGAARPPRVVSPPSPGGGAPGGQARETPQALLAMLEKPDGYVKLSGAYRLAPAPWTAMTPLARELARRIPENLLWGSDW